MSKKQKKNINPYAGPPAALSEPQSYWLGILLSDGSVATSAPTITLAMKDAEHIHKFAAFMETDYKVRSSTAQLNGKTFPYTAITVRDSALCTSLAYYGIVPRKTHTAQVHRSLLDDAHFWRGMIDGDGTFNYFDRKHEVTKALVVQLAGTESICRAFLSFCERLTGRRGQLIHRRVTTAKVAYINGKAAMSVLKHLYEGATVFLDRKMATFKKCVRLYTNAVDVHAAKSQAVQDRQDYALQLLRTMSVKDVIPLTGYRKSALYRIKSRYRLATQPMPNLDLNHQVA